MTRIHDGAPGRADKAQAGEALAEADRLTRRVRRSAAWYARFCAGFGVASGTFVLATSKIFGTAVFTVAAVGWLVFCVGMAVYAARQSVGPRGMAVRHGMLIASWAAVSLPVLIIGSTAFEGVLAWWLPGAIATSVPWFVGAVLEARRR